MDLKTYFFVLLFILFSHQSFSKTIRTDYGKINKHLSESIYKESGSLEYISYEIEHSGKCEISLTEYFLPHFETNEFSSRTSIINLTNLQPITYDKISVDFRPYADKPNFVTEYDNGKISEVSEIFLWHQPDFDLSKSIVNSINSIVESGKCQDFLTSKRFIPNFKLETKVVGDADVKMSVKTNIPGKVEVFVSFELEGIETYGQGIAQRRLLIENGKGETIVSAVSEGSKGVLYKEMPPGRYIAKLFFSPKWGLVDDKAKASGAAETVEISQPLKKPLKGQKEHFIRK